MAQDLTVHIPGPTELLVSISDGGAVPALSVGNLINALARDYRSMNRGRTLVVTRLETGSLMLYFQDAYQAAKPILEDGVGFAKGGKAILEFAKSLRDSLSKKKEAGADVGGKTGPYRAITEIVKIAAETGASVSLRHRSKDGDEIEVDVNQMQAVAIRETPIVDPSHLALSGLGSEVAPGRAVNDAGPGFALSLPGPEGHPTAGYVSSISSLPALADRLAQLPDWSATTPDPLIGITVRLLEEAGVGYLVESLATELEARGLFALAVAVRAEARGEDGPTVHTHI